MERNPCHCISGNGKYLDPGTLVPFHASILTPFYTGALQRGRRRGGRGGSCPPTFESWGAQPLQFFTSLCAVVIA